MERSGNPGRGNLSKDDLLRKLFEIDSKIDQLAVENQVQKDEHQKQINQLAAENQTQKDEYQKQINRLAAENQAQKDEHRKQIKRLAVENQAQKEQINQLAAENQAQKEQINQLAAENQAQKDEYLEQINRLTAENQAHIKRLNEAYQDQKNQLITAHNKIVSTLEVDLKQALGEEKFTALIDTRKKLEEAEERNSVLENKVNDLEVDLKKALGIIPKSERNKPNKPSGKNGEESNSGESGAGGGGGGGNGDNKNNSSYSSNKSSYDEACNRFRERKKHQKQLEAKDGREEWMTDRQWHIQKGSDPALIPVSELQMNSPMAKTEHIYHETFTLTKEEKLNFFSKTTGLTTSTVSGIRYGFKLVRTIEHYEYVIYSDPNFIDSKGEIVTKSISAGSGKMGPPNCQITWEGLVNSLISMSVFAIPMERIGRMLGSKYFNATNISRWLRKIAWSFLPIYKHFFALMAEVSIVEMDDSNIKVEEMDNHISSGDLKSDKELQEKYEDWDLYLEELANKSTKNNLKPLLSEVTSTMGRVASYMGKQESKSSYNISCISWIPDENDSSSRVVFFRVHFGSCSNLLSNALFNRKASNKSIVHILSDGSTVNGIDPELRSLVTTYNYDCRHHARRYVVAFSQYDENLGSYLLEKFLDIEELEWESSIAPITKEKVLEARKEILKIWKKIKEIVTDVVNKVKNEEAKNEIWGEGSKVYLGCNYILNHYDALVAYTSYYLISGHNSFIERAFRPYKRIMDAAHVRKSEECEVALDIIRTMASTCECAGLDFQYYLKLIFRTPENEIKANPVAFIPYEVAKRLDQ